MVSVRLMFLAPIAAVACFRGGQMIGNRVSDSFVSDLRVMQAEHNALLEANRIESEKRLWLRDYEFKHRATSTPQSVPASGGRAT